MSAIRLLLSLSHCSSLSLSSAVRRGHPLSSSLPCSGVVLLSFILRIFLLAGNLILRPIRSYFRFCSACSLPFVVVSPFRLAFFFMGFSSSLSAVARLYVVSFCSLFLLVTRMPDSFLRRQCLLFPLLLLGCIRCVGNPVQGLSIRWCSSPYGCATCSFLCSLLGVFLCPVCYAGFSFASFASLVSFLCFTLLIIASVCHGHLLVPCGYRSDSVTLALLVFLVVFKSFFLSLRLSAPSLVFSFSFPGFLCLL